jgi:hypothetical protein
MGGDLNVAGAAKTLSPVIGSGPADPRFAQSVEAPRCVRRAVLGSVPGRRALRRSEMELARQRVYSDP